MPRWRRCVGVGMLVFLFGPEPKVAAESAHTRAAGWEGVRQALATAVTGPFTDFMRRPLWLVILIFIVGYKLGEALAGVMATPLYISLGFSLNEIAAVSKLVGFFATVAGALIGGMVTARFGFRRSLVLCGVLQSAGNLFYVLQAVGGHRLGYLALCVTAENVTGAMAGTALVSYLSSLCSPAFTATQYALLSSLASVGRTLVASSGGVLAEKLGWVPFFLLTTVATVPALVLLIWIGPHNDLRNDKLDRAVERTDNTSGRHEPVLALQTNRMMSGPKNLHVSDRVDDRDACGCRETGHLRSRHGATQLGCANRGLSGLPRNGQHLVG
jgi:PAT family beta-lactamase induction signal transducer AmpG